MSPLLCYAAPLAYVEHHGVQPSGCLDDELEPPHASCVKAFPGRLANSKLTIPRAAHLDNGVIWCCQCIIFRHATNPLGFVLHTFHPHPSPHQTHHSPNQTHHSHDYACAALVLLRSPSGVCGNSTTAASLYRIVTEFFMIG